MSDIKCPQCGKVEWKAVEQFSALTPCTLVKGEDGMIEQSFDMRAEMARDAATSVTTMYLCANEECGFAVEPTGLNKLGS